VHPAAERDQHDGLVVARAGRAPMFLISQDRERRARNASSAGVMR
jgi:hypothetical protein